ncbi:RNA-directed DNA polymerase (Reverse transcriptase), partial [Trifolium medium]|nr:RNA-directed DNA polymerase (Reverse transcriptase) [Trifolium medium]
MINSFWWGGGPNNKGIQWLAWDRMALPKEIGGMGFHDSKAVKYAWISTPKASSK